MCTFNFPLHTHVQDHTVAVWDIICPMDIILRKVLKGHTGTVFAVDFDEKYIVSGSADHTSKVHMCGRRENRGREKGTEGEVERGRRGTGGRGACDKLEMLIYYQCVAFCFMCIERGL